LHITTALDNEPHKYATPVIKIIMGIMSYC